MIGRRRREARTAGESGFTLIELLVAMGIILTVLTLLVTATTTALNSQSAASARTQNASTATAAMNRVTRDLREAVLMNEDSAAAFTSATTTSVTFTTSIGTIKSGATTVSTGPTLVTFSVGTNTACAAPDNCLLETDQPTVLGTDAEGNTAWVAGKTSTVHVLVHHVTTPTPQVFSYYQTTSSNSGNPAAPNLTTTALSMTNGAVATADLDNISMVDVVISVSNPARLTAPATSIESRVYLPDTSTYASVAATS